MTKKTRTATVPAEDRGTPYRLGAGLVLFDRKGRVLVAERRDTPGAWQLPQGGIDEGEEDAPEQAAARELKEELGTDKVRLVGRLAGMTAYDFPDYLIASGQAFKGKYRGQKQIWFAFLFEGKDSDICLANEHEQEQPEFTRFKWVELTETPSLIVDFKRSVYEQVVAGFAALAAAIKAGRI